VQIRNVTKEELERALNMTNEKFDNNIIFNNFEAMNQKGNAYRVTLRVRDSHKKGSRLSTQNRHLINACWHVHGHFFDYLIQINPKAVIQTCKSKIYKVGNETIGNWEDYNIGSMIEPLYYSEACGCQR